MRRSHLLILSFLLSISTSLTGCSESTSDKRIIEYENEILRLTAENHAYEEKLYAITEDDPVINISYISYLEKYRFVKNSALLLWMPDTAGPSAQEIQANTLVEVLLAGYATENDLWLFVRLPVYDTPANCYGWIREAATEKYTLESREQILNPIIIKVGTKGFSSNGTEDISTFDRSGVIEKREAGKVLVMFAGGEELWYLESDIEYPPLDMD